VEVLDVDGERIRTITAFASPTLFARFELRDHLPIGPVRDSKPFGEVFLKGAVRERFYDPFATP
jgi:hypothetical protein